MSRLVSEVALPVTMRGLYRAETKDTIWAEAFVRNGVCIAVAGQLPGGVDGGVGLSAKDQQGGLIE